MTVARPSATVTAGARLWTGSLAVSASSVAVLAVASHFLSGGRFAQTSAVLAVAFVVNVLPAALQLRVAAGAADGVAVTVPWQHVRWASVAFAAVAVAVGPALHLPSLALVLVALQLEPASRLAARRGALIGRSQFAAAGASLAVEALLRVALGITLTVALGPFGLALALLAALAGALAVTAAPPGAAALEHRPTTSLGHTVASLGLVACFANLDLLVAPRLLDAELADTFARTALPSKGVFVALLAAGWLLFPWARRSRGARAALLPVALTFAAGSVLVVGLMTSRPIIDAVLGAPVDTGLLPLLAMAMAGAAATSAAVNVAVARGVRRPWLPLVPGLVIVAVTLGGAAPGPNGLAGMFFTAHLSCLASAAVVAGRS